MEELPLWLRDGGLEDIFARKYPGFSRFITIDSAPGAKKGDHYLSEITRFNIKYSDKHGKEREVSCIVKDSQKGCSSFLDEVNGVEKEMTMYNDIVPLMNEMLEERIAAEFLMKSPEGDLLLEDLGAEGYKGTDRMAYLDMDHCMQALATIAKFHASSFKIQNDNSKSLSIVGEETAFTESKDNINYFYGSLALKRQVEVLSQHTEGVQFRGALEKFISVFWEEIFHAINTRRGFSVLNHGDFWTTNIMFKYENGIPVHAKLVDFQLTRYTSPSFDLHLFIATSIRPDIRETRLDELLDFYVTELNNTLQKLKISHQLTRPQLDQMMFDTRAIAFVYGLTLVPITLCDPNDPLQIADISRDDFIKGFPNGNPYEKAYIQPHIVNHLINLLKFYRKNKYL